VVSIWVIGLFTENGAIQSLYPQAHWLYDGLSLAEGLVLYSWNASESILNNILMCVKRTMYSAVNLYDVSLILDY
jgi:hypothetical protein